MKKIVCEMCDCTEFVKEDGLFVCQECGCKYTPEDARKLMVEMPDEQAAAARKPEVEDDEEEEAEEEGFDPRAGYPLHTSDSPNRISVTVEKVGHETYTMRSVTSLSALFGEPEPEFVEGPDVVGHIGAAITIKNLAGKAIKYITVYLTPYNNVGDAVECTVGGHSTYGIEVTGPIAVSDQWQGYSDGMWYNNSIVGAQIAFATVEFMDGSRELFEAESLVKMESGKDFFTLTVSYDCNAGAPQVLWYSIDGGEKITLNKYGVYAHYLKTGWHTLTVKNPFMKKDYSFNIKADKTLSIYGKSFSMDFNES